MSQSDTVVLANEVRDAGRSRAFYFQYMSLMLIILTFVTGAFQRRSVENLPKVQVHDTSVVVPNAPKIAEKNANPVHSFVAQAAISQDIELQGIVNTHGRIVSTPTLEAILTVLKNHDVNSEFEVQTAETSLLRGLDVGTELNNFLDMNGVGDSTVNVFVVGRSDRTDEEVRIVARITTEYRANEREMSHE